ncbi:MAG TPA: DUF6259 domain-containing protein [Candidatus Bathyarchaeia archaeon]|nr:DUF6259 domain-containing protein [Candidatus Bathyarchaeia archaeon]
MNISLQAVCLLLVALAQVATPAQLANDHLAVGFDPATGGIVRVEAVAANHAFIHQAAEKPLLWQLDLREASGQKISLDNSLAPAPEITAEPPTVTLRWTGLDLADEKGALDVAVVCELGPSDHTARLRMTVNNNSQRFGLWNVQFPVVSNLSDPASASVAMGRGTWGVLYNKPKERLKGEYPANTLPMQFVLLQEGDHGLYLAAEDPQALFKIFEIEVGKDFRVITRASDMAVPGSDWEAPYAFAIGEYDGGWMQGCKRYRAWAQANAPWLRKGLLAQRTDVPESIKNVCAWLLGGGTAGEAVPAVKQFAEAVKAPVGVHWYNWHAIPFDVQYPNYFPTKEGFADGVAELTKMGVVVMPYINARLWDTANENFAEAKPFATKDEDGDVTIEEYGSGAKLAVMCPTQKFWQDKVAEIIRRLGEECGVNAVYMDQIASAPPRVCFDIGHGHSAGSGAWWVSGYRDMLAPIKAWCTSGGRSVGLTTENDAEPYMDNVDAHLIWTPRSENDIPMMTAVYSGYTLYFASNRAFFDDVSYCLCQARDFTWGTQLGWDGAAILTPEHAAKLEMIGRLARLRAKSLDYFVYGELLEVLDPTNEVPVLTGKWNTPKGDAEVKVPAVHGALWRGHDGSRAVILANADTEARPFAFEVDGAPHTVEVPARDGVVQVLK